MTDIATIDQTDREIIALLRADGRRTFADIAERVSVSAPAVKRRVDRLERDGYILGYTAVVDHARLGAPLHAFVELQFDGRTKVDDIAAVARGLPEIEALYTTAGDPDALGLLRAGDVDHLKRVIDTLRRSRYITGTKTLMVLGTWKPWPGSTF
ncbi:MAG TPA: Lrp/AsnC family transcriptional regulator [Conexibacter sp.]|nr:Lrp/AsnC family transcriptional regulator [Conexibacter sp.]